MLSASSLARPTPGESPSPPVNPPAGSRRKSQHLGTPNPELTPRWVNFESNVKPAEFDFKSRHGISTIRLNLIRATSYLDVIPSPNSPDLGGREGGSEKSQTFYIPLLAIQ